MKIGYKINLTPYQWEFCNSTAKYRIVIASTKVGKTYSCMSYIVKRALEGTDGDIFWWVAPIRSQAKIAFRRINKMLSKHGDIFKINKSDLLIRFPNGSELHFKSADNPDSLYGEGVNFVVFDEFTRASFESWVSVRSTLTQTKGDAILIGNYTGDSNWGVQLKEKAMEENSAYKFWKLTAWDAVEAGILDAEEVEQAAKDLPLPVFKALYLAEGGFNPDLLVDQESVNDLFTNTQIQPTGEYFISADIAMQGKDKLVIGVWNGWVLEEIKVLHSSDGKEVEDLIKELKNKYNVPNSRIIYDSVGVGNYLQGYFKNALAFNGSKAALGSKRTFENRRSQALYELSVKIKERAIHIKDSAYQEDIKKEMQCLKIKNWEGGRNITLIAKPDMKKIIGRSPDFLDMLALRVFIDVMPKLNNF